MTERRYNEDEVALILSRAVESRPDEVQLSAAKGLTLPELKDIAAEVGIEPDRVDNAARALESRGASPRPGTAMGMQTTVQFERVVPVALQEKHLPRMLDVIRDKLARQGIVEEVLGGIEWRARGGMGGRYLSIRPDGDQTRIRALGNFRDGLLGFTLGGGPMAAATAGGLAAGLGLTGALVILPIAIAGGLLPLLPWRHLFARETSSLEHVVEALERTLLEMAAPEDG